MVCYSASPFLVSSSDLFLDVEQIVETEGPCLGGYCSDNWQNNTLAC